MKNFLHINHKESVYPPERFSIDLNRQFNMPINVEWFEKGQGYEALFYCDSLEHIALYSKDGGLINYRINVSPPALPDDLKNIVEEGYELMNVVRTYVSDKEVSYEAIVRDKKLERYLLKINSAGQMIEKLSL